MNIGLNEKEVALIYGVLKNANAIDKAVIFGSRAKGNSCYNSDIDLALFGENYNLTELHEKLDDLPLPYKFDLVNYTAINNNELKNHIDRVGVVLYAQN